MPPPRTDPFYLGYAMGLIVGEGSFTGDARRGALSLKLHQRDPGPFQLLRYVLGGRVYGPYTHSNRHYALYQLRGADLEAALPLFDRYLPPSYRREQYVRWRTRYFPHVPVSDVGHISFAGLDE
ncbi:MAG: hypothetical protein JO180_03990 [Gemmatirosa sp.]|nr:hypothetical protein [Gemmatirosa sp.]